MLTDLVTHLLPLGANNDNLDTDLDVDGTCALYEKSEHWQQLPTKGPYLQASQFLQPVHDHN
jgi:hypothetical protein